MKFKKMLRPAFKHSSLWLACSAVLISTATAQSKTEPNKTDQSVQNNDIALLTPQQIEMRLTVARNAINLEQRLLNDLSHEQTQVDELPEEQIISRLHENKTPVGLDTELAQEMSVQPLDKENLNPAEYLLDIQAAEMATLPVITHDAPKTEGAIRRLYNRLFNDGVAKVPRLKAHLYHASQQQGDEPVEISRKTLMQEPYANMKAALEDITQESVTDFNGSLPRMRQAVQAAARAVGYYSVDFSLQKQKAGEVNLIIHQLGDPVKVDNRVLEVRGDGQDNADYQAVVNSSILQAGDVFHHGKYEASKSAIETISGEQGFLDGKWLNKSVDVVLPDNIADVSLIYDTGVQYQFDEVVFFTIDPDTGMLTTDPDKLPVKPKLLKKLLNFQLGDAYNRQAVRELSNSLLATGYFNAVNTETIYPQKNPVAGVEFDESNKPKESVTQTVELGDGITADIAPIEFSASEVIKDKLNLVAQKAQRLYDLPDDRLLPIDQTQNRSTSLLGKVSDAIKHVAKVILPDESKDVLDLPEGISKPELAGKKTAQAVYEDKKVPLYIFVMSDKPRDAHIGLGWGSDSGTRLITKFEHNLINRNGYQAGTEVRLSEDKKGIKLYASRPLSHPINDKLQASLSYFEEVVGKSTNGFDLTTRTLEQGIGRNIINKNGWNRSYSLRYRLDELETKADPSTWQDLPVNFRDGKPTQEALLAGFALHKTVADDLVNPLRGYRQNYSLEVGSKELISDADMAIVQAGVSGVYSFGHNAYGKDRAHQVVAGLQGGYIWTNDFDAVPYKLRFFAGGDQSVRGYNHGSLSPVSDKGYLTGGQALAVGSVEYNYELMKDFRLAVFGDVGGAYDKKFSTPTKVGAGVGIRWASPVGQVRVDVATGLKEQDTQIKLHFFIGTPF